MNGKRIAKWSLAGLAGLLLVCGTGGYLYLRSDSFRQFALRKIVAEADQATGGHTQIGSLDFSLSTLTAHLYDITVRGNEAPGQPPLLHADKLTVGLTVLSAIHRQVVLSELIIDRPIVHLRVAADGKNNLPTAPPGSTRSGSSTSVFDLGVRHAQISNGEVYYNDKKTPVDADLYDLGTEIRFATLAQRYEGTLSYDNGHVRYAEYAPMPHSLKLSFSATPDQFNLQSLMLKIGASTATLNANVTNYSNPVVNGDYEIEIHAQDFGSMAPGTQPTGDIALNGKLHYQAVGNDPLLRDVQLNGKLASDVLAAVASGTRVEARKLQGTYRLAGGNLEVSDLSVEGLGGRILANAEIKHLDATPEGRVQASLRNISLREIQQIARAQTPGAALAGTIGGTADVSWNGSLSKLKAHSDLSMQALASSRTNRPGKEVPVDGAIHVSYDGTRQTIELRNTSLRMPSATLTANGLVGDHSSLQVRLTASDLHQLTQIAASFLPPQTKTPAISGSATLNAVVRGSMNQPLINAQLNAQNVEMQGSEWRTVKMQLRATPSEFTVQSGSLVSAHRGQANFNASVVLHNWSYLPDNPIRASIDLQQMSLTDLQRLANQNLPIAGDLSVKASIGGTELNPTGSGSARVTNGRAYGETIQNLAADFKAENGSISSTLNLTVPAGGVNANVFYTPKTQAYQVKLDAPSIVLQKLQSLQGRDLSGTVSATVTGQGTVDDPQLDALIQLPQLQVKQNNISAVRAQLHVAQHNADVDLETNVLNAPIKAHAKVALSGNFSADAVVDTGSIPLGAVVAAYSPNTQGFAGEAQLHATLKGPLKDRSQMEAHMSIPVLKATYQSLEIGIANPIRADYVDSVVTLQPADIRGTDTSLHLAGRMPTGGSGTPTLAAQGTVDMKILKIFETDLDSSGTLALDVRAAGSTSHPAVQGKLQFKDVALSTEAAPIGVEKLNGALNIADNRVEVSNMTAQVGGGEITMGGSINYSPAVNFNLALQGHSIRLRYPDGLRTLLDTNLTFTGDMQASTLNGKVLLDSLSFTPDFDLTRFGDQFSTGGTISQPGFADTIKLGIAVQSQENLNATSSQVTLAGRAALQVGGTAANPVITGRTTLSSGELFFRNTRYQIQKGVITFDDPNVTHPVMNVSVSTIIEQYNLTLTMRGPLDKLTTSYVSDPPLSTADIINLVARGKTTQESAASTESTDSMIASQAASQLSSSVQKLAGISSLQISPTVGGNNQSPSAVVAIQQRVTKNLLFTFSTDVTQPGSEAVSGEYQLNKRWSVSMSRDQLGGFSVDGRYHTRF
jgi:translocation and assembly module TamB